MDSVDSLTEHVESSRQRGHVFPDFTGITWKLPTFQIEIHAASREKSSLRECMVLKIRILFFAIENILTSIATQVRTHPFLCQSEYTCL